MKCDCVVLLTVWPWPLTFQPPNHVTFRISRHSLYQVWTLWDHSFLNCAADKQTDKQSDSKILRLTMTVSVGNGVVFVRSCCDCHKRFRNASWCIQLLWLPQEVQKCIMMHTAVVIATRGSEMHHDAYSCCDCHKRFRNASWCIQLLWLPQEVQKCIMMHTAVVLTLKQLLAMLQQRVQYTQL